jgi:hypothetical protein
MGSHRAAKEMVGQRFGVADVSYLVGVRYSRLKRAGRYDTWVRPDWRGGAQQQ